MRVHTASHLSARLRELAILRLVSTLGAAYEWASHVPGARQAGITDDEIRAVRAGDLTGFTAHDEMALRFAAAVEARSVDDTLWAEARELFSEVELVDLTLVSAFYGLASRCVLAFDVPLDDGLHGFELP